MSSGKGLTRTLPFTNRLFGSACLAAFFAFGLVVSGSASKAPVQSVLILERRGTEALHARQFATAERIFASLVKQDPTAPNFGYLAVAEAACGHDDRAIIHFRKSIQLGNDAPSVHYYLALAYLKDHQLQRGMRQLEITLTRDPGYVAARLALGIALLDAGRPRTAIRDLKAVEVPLAKNPWMWANLVRAEFRVDDTKSALQTIHKGLDALPGDTRLPVALAEICLRHRQPQKARELLENATEAAPDNPRLRLLLAEASLKAEDPEETLAVVRGLPASVGKPGQVAFLRGSALLQVGKTKEAEPQIAAAVAAAPRNVDYISKYAEIEAIQRDYIGAEASLEQAHAMKPTSPVLPYQMAVIYVLMHRYHAAEGACRQATRLAPEFSQAYFLLGVIAFDENEPQAAQVAFRRAEAINPMSAPYHSALGAAVFETGRLAEATKELDKALKLDPRTLSAYFWRAKVYAREKQTGKAIANLETFIALHGELPEAYKQLARLYAGEGQTAKASVARAQYVALKKKSGQTPVPFFLSTFGMTRFLQVRSQN
jgi:predicted Zn-dependent protease